jgi:hypothetical protein
LRNEDMHLKSDPEKELTAFDENRAETEKELWRRCSEGDDEAREELILAYRSMVYWLAKKLRVPVSLYLIFVTLHLFSNQEFYQIAALLHRNIE